MIATPALAKLLARLLPTSFPRLALPPGSLTHEQLLALRRLAISTGDARLHTAAHRAMGAWIGARRCVESMAYCVQVQADLEGALGVEPVSLLVEVA